MRILLSFCLALIFIPNIFSQCDQAIDQPIIINEIGSYVEGGGEFHVNAEYIELLVVGQKENPFAKVNIAGYKIDDNNFTALGIGNEPGHIVFSSSFPKVEPGALILIYNPEGGLIDQSLDGLPNANGVYQLPISHESLIKCEGFPSNIHDRQYEGCKYASRGEEWDEFIPFRNAGDVAQLRTSSGELVHAISWWIGYPISFQEQSIEFSNTSLKNKSIQFIGENPNEKPNYVVQAQGTPGAPNNDVNADIIDNLQNGILFNELELKVEIIQNASDGLQNGIVEVSYIGPPKIEEFNLQGVLDGTNLGIQQLNFPFTIENLATGSHNIIVTDYYDECFSLEADFNIISEEITETEICEGDCITLNSDDVDPNLIASSPCIKWINENGDVISSGTEVEVCPDGPEEITQYIENVEGIIQEVVYHQVNIIDMSFTIDEKIPDECPPAEIEIAIEGENISEILWEDGSTSYILIVSESGEYNVTVTSPTGCDSESSVSISEEIFLDTDGDGVCDQNDCDPYVPTSGGEGTPCDDNNASTINDQFNADCECIGEIDPDDPCEGEDIDGDGICDDDEITNGTSPFNACDPNNEDSDSDGLCDNVDCDPDDPDISYSVGSPCDDGNASTIGDIVNSNCQCVGIADPNSDCPGNDMDGDGICDDQDDFPEDDCNVLSVEIEGDITLCKNETATDLTATREGGVEPYSFEWSNGDATSTITVYVNGPDDLTHSVTITDGNGCTASASVTITQYEEEDTDGDGFCDDEECPKTEVGEYGDFPLLIGSIEIVDDGGIKGEDVSGTRNELCDLIENPEIIYTENFQVSLLEFTSIKFTKSYCTQTGIGDVDAIAFILENYYTFMNDCASEFPNKIFLIITDEEDYDKCCDLKEKIEEEYYNNNDWLAGIWIDLKTNDSGEVVGELKTAFNTIENECDYPWAGPIAPNIFEGDPFAKFTPINNSLFNNFTSTIIPNPSNLIGNVPYNGPGLSDFAGLSEDVKTSIEENVAIGKDVWSGSGFSYDARFIVSSANCMILIDGQGIESEKAAQDEFEADNANDLVVWIHFDENNNALFDAKINANIDQELKEQIKDNLSFAAQQSLSDISGKAVKPADLDPELDGENLWRFGLRKDVEAQTNFWGITKEIGGLSLSALQNVAIPEQLWRENGDPDGRKSMFKMPPSVAGVSDALLENNPVGEAVQLVQLARDVVTKPEVRSGICQAVSHPLETASKMMSQYSDDISGANGKEQQHFVTTKASVGGIIGILIGGGKLIDFIQQAGKNKSKIVEGFKDFLEELDGPNVEAFYGKIKDVLTTKELQDQFINALGDIGKPKYKALVDNPYLVDVWKKYLDEFPGKMDEFLQAFKNGKIAIDNPKFYVEFKKVFVDAAGTVNGSVTQFFEDLNTVSDVDFVQLFKVKPKAVKAWKVLSDNADLRKVVDNIKKVNGHLAKNIHSADELEIAFKVASDKTKWLDDIGYNVLRKANNKAEYINPSNSVLKWSGQHPNSINQSIQSALGSANPGKKIEGKVGNYVQQQGKTVDGFGMQINNSTTGNLAGDVDVMTPNNIIEVKKSYNAWTSKKKQVEKFVDKSLPNYLNPYNKNGILYIDEALTAAQKAEILNTIPSNVTLVNSLEELGQILQ